MLTVFVPGVMVEFRYRGTGVRFFVRNVADIVQSAHANGGFYEQDYLEVLERYLKPGGVFLDVGANVGNHAVFVARFGGQREVIVIEPNPEAIGLLRINLLLNGLDIDASHLGVGLSDRSQNAEAKVPANNLGGARMVPSEAGAVKLVTGDSLFAGREVDVIKIDVEGQELAALAGLAQTIAANRPTMFIEVGEENRDAFFAWVEQHGYEVAWAFPRYRLTQNVIVRPKA
jgi:FkbM family methyltransferase